MLGENTKHPLWQRCEVLGQFEDFKDDHVEMNFDSENKRWIIRHDGDILAFIYENAVYDSVGRKYEHPWTIVAILSHIESLHETKTKAAIEPTQEQLKAIFNHVTKLTSEEAENLGFQYSLTARTNFPRIELQIVSFSKYGNNKDQWKCTIVHQSPTDPKHEQYSFQSSYDFETTCHRLWWPAVNFEEEKAKEEVEESQQDFVSIPVAEFQEIQSQIKELMDWKNGMTEPLQEAGYIPTPEQCTVLYNLLDEKMGEVLGYKFYDSVAATFKRVIVTLPLQREFIFEISQYSYKAEKMVGKGNPTFAQARDAIAGNLKRGLEVLYNDTKKAGQPKE